MGKARVTGEGGELKPIDEDELDRRLGVTSAVEWTQKMAAVAHDETISLVAREKIRE